jgi:hypothetical protein
MSSLNSKKMYYGGRSFEGFGREVIKGVDGSLIVLREFGEVQVIKFNSSQNSKSGTEKEDQKHGKGLKPGDENYEVI